MGLHLGLELSRQLSKAIVQYLGQSASCLVVLDNFETPWEPMESRGQVEEFLSLLADIPSYNAGSRKAGQNEMDSAIPPPLEPLSPSASRQIFIEVADEPSSIEESALDTLLNLSDSLPLAVSLMANIASYEGYSGTLARWKIENITLVSGGHDKRSNLEKSITLSLGSPRLSSSPHAKNLLSLLSLLPDGIRTEDAIVGKVPIPDIRRWQSLLVGMSLAYINVKGRLKALSPIREYIRRVHPAPVALYSPLRIYFQDLIELWSSNRELSSGDLAPALVANLGNIHELVLQSLLSAEKSALIEIGHSIIRLDSFSIIMLKGSSRLFQQLPHLIKVTGDSGLRWEYTGKCISRPELRRLVENVDSVVEEGIHHFATGTNSPTEVHYYTGTRSVPRAVEFTKMALSLAWQTDDKELQLRAMETEFHVAHMTNDPHWGIKVAQKAWKIARFTSNYWHYRCTAWEAWSTCHTGNLSRALELCKIAEELLISDGMEGSDRYLSILDLLFDIHFIQTNYIKARHILAQIVQMTTPMCSPWFHAYSLSMIAYIDILTGCEVTKIIENHNRAEAVYATHGISPPICLWVAGELQLYRGDNKTAHSSFMACLSKSHCFSQYHQYCLAALGDPKHRMHGTLDTFRWTMVYFAFEQKRKQLPGMLTAFRCLADLYITFGDTETALNLFQTALEGGKKLDIHRLRAECMVGIGDIMMLRGNTMQAEEMWTGAHPLFVCSSCTKDAASVEERLEKLTRGVGSVTVNLGKGSDAGQSSIAQLQTILTPNNPPPDVQSYVELVPPFQELLIPAGN
ncbi:hypothetical protein B0H13DRAFT_1920997 [Mycena leptocephala]|nr:hypothetical protein B0H13DRAFT_1920997 [Mycena leptocephala]